MTGHPFPLAVTAFCITAALLLASLAPAAPGQAVDYGRLGYDVRQSGLEAALLDDAAELERIAVREGIPAALEALGRIERSQRIRDHDVRLLAAHVGASALAGGRYASHLEALRACDQRFHFGCARGVSELYLRTEPGLDPVSLQNACGPTKDAPEDPSDDEFVNQTMCLRALGAYVYSASGGELVDALARCDELDTDLTRWRCRSAVFSSNNLRLAQEGPKGPLALQWDLADPRYPCSRLGPAHQRECYTALPDALRSLTGRVEAARDACAAAPAAYVTFCFRAYGRQLSTPPATPASAHQGCAGLAPEHLAACYFGAAELLAEMQGRPEQAMPLCAGAPAAAKDPCYESVGTIIHNLFWTEADRRRECARSEPDHVGACIRGAIRGST